MADASPPSIGSGSRHAEVLDLSRPNAARVFGALLGGKDAYNSDRYIADKLLANNSFRVAVAEARAFKLRAVEHLVGNHGVTQIVELGCGYPNEPTVHAVACRQNRIARTLYIDHDPLVAVHARALLSGANSVFVDADLIDTTDTVERIAEVMDASSPMVVCLSGTAEFLPDAPAIVAALISRLPADTWLLVTHTAADLCVRDIDSAVTTLAAAGISYCPRDRDQVEEMLAPLRLLEPGLVTADLWRPDLEVGNPENGSGVWLKPTVCSYAAVGQLAWCSQAPRPGCSAVDPTSDRGLHPSSRKGV
ncbi:SAM-dependent methyltransferase [Nocardia sp. NPDC058497]|uniref:SAM-dependent methyltransferase n=1 Tax=Nocardia sp. NPDC058497 TaxID=3346529 RepID=UPI00365A6998